MDTPLLRVRDLSVDFNTRAGLLHALDRVTFDIGAGEITGIIGESGSGKSVTAQAITGILDTAAILRGGQVRVAGRDVLALSPRALRQWQGTKAAIIFQNPRGALNPIRPVGMQIADVIAAHRPAPKAEIRAQVLAALDQVHLPDPERCLNALPSQLSGGQCQRIAIALALACAPRLLIADEPTTGLDVTTQAAVMGLIRDLARAKGMAVAFITHDLALAAEYCDRLIVMHAGQVVEMAATETILSHPRHPYTAGLLRSVPALNARLDDLHPIAGALPDLTRDDLPPCRFAERCPRRLPICDAGRLDLRPLRLKDDTHLIACRNPL